MTWVTRLRRRWQLAGFLAEAEARGHTLIDIPTELQAEVQQLRWNHKVQKSYQRWATSVDNVPVTEWQAAVEAIGRHRILRPRKRR